MKQILYFLFMISCVSCKLSVEQTITPPQEKAGKLDENKKRPEWIGDLKVLHRKNDFNLLGADISDDGNSILFSEMASGIGSGTTNIRLFRKNLADDSMFSLTNDLDAAIPSGSNNLLYLQVGWAGSGRDLSHYHLDGNGDFSYFAVNDYDPNRTPSIKSLLYRRGGPESNTEKLFETDHLINLSKGSVTQDGQYVLFASSDLSLLNDPSYDPAGYYTGISNLFRLNTSTKMYDAITRIGLSNPTYIVKQSISDDGDTVLYEIRDSDNTYSQPIRGASAHRTAIILEKLSQNSKTLISDISSFPSQYEDVTFLKIAGNGTHAALEYKVSAPEGIRKEQYLYDLTKAPGSGRLTLVNVDPQGQMIPSMDMQICDISSDGKQIGIISTDMRFIGQQRFANHQLFVRNMETNLTTLISAMPDGTELPGSIVTCYFNNPGTSIVFTYYGDNSQMILQKDF